MFLKEFWCRTYTREDPLVESKWLLLFVGAASFQISLFLAIQSTGQEGAMNPLVYGEALLGVIYTLIALIPVYWLRFVFLFVWLADLVATNFIVHFNPLAIFFIVVAVYFVYKMVRYARDPDKNKSKDAEKDSQSSAETPGSSGGTIY